MWRGEPPEPIENITSNNKDQLVATTVNGNILHFDNDNWTFKYIQYYESKFNDLCLVYPIGKYIVTLAQNKQLTTWEIANGNMVRFVLQNQLFKKNMYFRKIASN